MGQRSKQAGNGGSISNSRPPTLPEGYIFRQSSLQDYAECARRFELRYLRHCHWPAPHTKDALLWEQVTQRGFAFHRLLRQLHSGIPSEVVERVAAADPDLFRWWRAYRELPPTGVPNELRLGEASLQARIGNYRIEARYDLLAGDPGKRWLILDWKTNAHRPDQRWLAKRLQSQVYPWVLVSAGQQLNGGVPIQPEQVEMCYWFAEFPAQPERFAYNAERFESDGQTVSGLVAAIADRAEGAVAREKALAEPFPRTESQAYCRFCVYRSLCWDSVQAGELSELEDTDAEPPTTLEIDLEELTPIPF